MAAIVIIVLSNPVSFTYWPRSSEVIRGHQRCPDHLLQLFLGNTSICNPAETPDICSVSWVRFRVFRLDTPKTLYIDVVEEGAFLNAKPPQLAPSECMQVQKLYSQLFSNESALHPSSNTEPTQPGDGGFGPLLSVTSSLNADGAVRLTLTQWRCRFWSTWT